MGEGGGEIYVDCANYGVIFFIIHFTINRDIIIGVVAMVIVEFIGVIQDIAAARYGVGAS